MLELHIAETEITSGTVTLSWCIDKDTIDYLKGREVVNPAIVIVIIPDDKNYSESKEFRTVVPLNDLIAYVPVRYPGKNKIFAFISHTGIGYAKTLYLDRYNSRYSKYILIEHYRGETKIIDYNNTDPINNAEPIIIDVPKECFAKEPAEWEKAWVNHFLSARSIDQCSFRRKRIFAYTIQPIIILLITLLNLFVLLCGALYVSRGLTLKYLLHPLTYDAEGILVLSGGSYLIPKLELENDTGPQAIWFGIKKLRTIIFTPIGLIILCFLYHAHLIIPALIIVLVIAVLASITILFASGSVSKWLDLLHSKQSGKNKSSPWYENKSEVDILMCSPNKKITKLADLPKDKKTIKLRFKDLKSRVCKPYSG